MATLRLNIEKTMADRYYFHLMDESVFLRDSLGVECGRLIEVESAAIEIVGEFRRQEASRENELRYWKLAVTDSSGTVIFLLPLFAPES
jgi:hypothetical protein